jgi:ribonuclease R
MGTWEFNIRKIFESSNTFQLFMVTKTQLLEFMQHASYRPLSLKELIEALGIDSEERPAFKKLIRELVQEGEIVETREGRYGPPGRMNLVVGYLQGHPNGYGFVIPKEKGAPDLYIRARNLAGAFHGDLVVARIERRERGGRVEGRIIRILKRGHHTLVGTYEAHKGYGFVIPEDPKIPYDVHVEKEDSLGARDGQIVVVEITEYPEQRRNPIGRVIEILGDRNTPRIDEEIVIREYELPVAFSPQALEEAAAIPNRIPRKEIARRKDLRDLLTLTIDGEKAKDFDDAVSIEMLEKGHYRLGVHIADVSYYVREQSAMDREAYQRGTSVYFPDRAIPMLPPKLSDDMCSLVPQKSRLTLSVFMEFTPQGEKIHYDIFESVIRSRYRLTYTLVRQILQEEDPKLLKKYRSLIPSLQKMRDLAQILYEKRIQRGSLDFDLPEPEIILDLQGDIENIIRAERNIAHRIIEEFMIAANETVASHMTWLNFPSIYRIHEKPDPEKLAEFGEFVRSLGYNLKITPNVHPRTLQRFLEQVKGKPLERLINTLLLRSMKQARYSATNEGHFGLASECYTHFTSPIRRYPDLLVHRMLKKTWEGENYSRERLEELETLLEEMAQHASMRERVAMDAERDIIAIKKVKFMQDKLGEIYEGVISGVTAYGLFVELKDFYVEGLVHVSSMYDDYYHFQEDSYALVGERTHKVYQLGDEVKVQVVSVNVPKRQIDFLLVEEKQKPMKSGRERLKTLPGKRKSRKIEKIIPLEDLLLQ